ncbi:tRNA synthetase class I (I [Striga asiatica]|uniref:tRNA synthetase class I (I) n=1 Tax=Striga asiatica TaxID=4170 RepID=A0A5A7Q3L1_STRAF|nr:tRNA synthetase class I (I [Striga asiatica]
MTAVLLQVNSIICTSTCSSSYVDSKYLNNFTNGCWKDTNGATNGHSPPTLYPTFGLLKSMKLTVLVLYVSFVVLNVWISEFWGENRRARLSWLIIEQTGNGYYLNVYGLFPYSGLIGAIE